MENQKLIQQGAEAKILLNEKDNYIIKDRIEKSYRLKELDVKIRKLRTRQETKLLEKASKIIDSPLPNEQKDKNSTKITMPFIKGKKLSEYLDKLSEKHAMNVCEKIGASLAQLHDNNIIHGDLTTSNLILDKKEKVWFIDFGLGFHSMKLEDKAVDLHLIKEALEAKHYKNHEKYFNHILQGYNLSKNHKETIERLKKVESRGRYKERY
ncbi:Kae1-associated serine/threonine protein kinase [Candidatus Pacearchaeota archaeon]|nr:Kae1-associated serine/threonine protein kinase [Candidatus Pacearchaeota archaeon]